VRFISIPDKKYTDDCIKLDSQPQSVSAGGLGMVVVACLEQIVVIQDKKMTHKYKINTAATAVAISTSLGKVLVGTEESKVVVYDIEGDQLKETSSFPSNGSVTGISFSPSKEYVAVCTSKKQVKIVLTSDFKTEKANWGSHSGKVNGIAWTPDSRFVASCGIDGTVYTYEVEAGQRRVNMRGAHSQSVDVTSVLWSNDSTLLTTGRQDCSIKLWQIK